MFRKIFTIFSYVLVVSIALSAAMPVMAAGPANKQIVPNTGPDTIDHPATLPRGASNAVINVVIRLADQSVAETQATAGRKLSDSEDHAIRDSLRSKQDSLKGSIARAGGHVTDQFQSAINGIRVQTTYANLAKLAALPGVVEVLPVQKFTIDNATSVPYIGAPTVWDAGAGPNLHGEGIKVGIIDSGIDYTHANFGGPGTPAAYAAAQATSTDPADPALFGPGAPKVKGGYDLVGDAYDANISGSLPQPDPNPLDCGGHGSHVGGTIGGFGLNADGTTYTGPYNSSIYTPGAFLIGPGVAPKADLYSYRVFGCSGTTDIVVDAIDRAVADGMDVINMSLGSDFGAARTADAVAADNAARAGVIVVASAGNSYSNPYIVGSPSSANGAISVAASDPYQTYPGAQLALSTGAVIPAIIANGAAVANGTTYSNILVLVDNPATAENESLGCSVADYPNPMPANTLAVVIRGVCSRVAKAVYGQQAGAAAVAMVNNSTGLPPYEGAIFSNPDDGTLYTVTIPFFGVKGLATTATSDGAKLRAATGGTATAVNAASFPNPGFSAIASFSSGGPRVGDSFLKPEITAPGVSIFSTLSGSGNMGEYLSGTSMAAPHVAGVAALVKQAHPDWSEEDLKAAIVGTSNPGAVAGFSPRTSGAGLVQPYAAVLTNVVAAGGEHGVVALNFGFQELQHDLSQTGHIKVSNNGSKPVTFKITITNQSGVSHTLTPKSSTIKIGGHEDANVELTLNVPAATAGDSSDFYDAAGIVTFTPVGSGNNGVVLNIPYYLVPRPLSNLSAKSSRGEKVSASNPSTTVTVSNKKDAAIPGNADFYAWGIHSNPTAGNTSNDVRDVGVQVFQNAAGPNNPFIVFAVNTYHRWSNASTNEFDIYIDVDPQNNNGDDYVVFGYDYGAITTGSFTGQYGTFVQSLWTGSISFLNPANTYAPTDSSSAALAIIGSYLCKAGTPCLSVTNPRFTYHVVSFDLIGTGVDVVPGVASFNAFAPSISTGDYLPGIVPGASASTNISINPAEWAKTPALGVMILTTDNKAGTGEAQEVKLSLKK
jgi:subtilisin family serine protease